MKKDKLIICSPQLGISQDSNSGGEVYDREVLRHLAKLGDKIEIILPKNLNYDRQIKNWRITSLPIKTVFPPYLFNLLLIPILLKLYKSKKFDVLRVHSPYFVGLAAIFFKWLNPNVPVIASYLHLENKNIVFRLIDNLIVKKFDHIITISSATKKEIIKNYQIDSKKITVTYPGVDPKFKPKPKNKKLMDKLHLGNKKILLYLGGLKFRKNVSFLIDVLKELEDKDVILLICGEGDAKKYLISKTKLLGLEKKVKFTGYVSEKDKVDYFNLADISLVPSYKEGFGMISTEAQACGKPVIVADSSSLPETIINGKTGFACSIKDKKAWVQKVNMLFSDHDLRKRMGKDAAKLVRLKFSWRETAKVQRKIFTKVSQ